MSFLEPIVPRLVDPRLDLVFDKDPGNRNYGVEIPTTYKKRARRWPRSPITDQGREGACVGHGCGRFAFSRCGMHPTGISLSEYCFGWYKETQANDEWQGENYSGTSVRAGGATGVRRGLIKEYRWAFGIDQALEAITTVGPLVLGIPWFDSMYETDGNGFIQVSGTKVGGHCIDSDYINWRNEYLELPNSWGLGYGNQGVGKMKFETLDSLLRQGGEVMVPIPVRTRNWK